MKTSKNGALHLLLQASLVVLAELVSGQADERDRHRQVPYSETELYVHDESFQPDRILRVTAVNYPLDCTVRYSVLINGTHPGPELRFREGDKVWIRVYNDMTDENLTMVCEVDVYS